MQRLCRHGAAILDSAPAAGAARHTHVGPDLESYPATALARVAGAAAAAEAVTVPLSFFDYEGWDKVTKPAGFNMEIPPELQAEAELHTSARRNAAHDTNIYAGRRCQDQMSLDTVRPFNPRPPAPPPE